MRNKKAGEKILLWFEAYGNAGSLLGNPKFHHWSIQISKQMFSLM
jgi:hypothetical protein